LTIQIIDLVRRFDAGEILLPMMQRDYVWKPVKVVKLLDSLYRRWPIGCFYVWHTKHQQRGKAKFGGVNHVAHSIDGFYGFLLDGQQRLTSLSLAIAGDAAEKFDTRAFFDVEKERFFLGGSRETIKKRIEAGDPSLIPLSDLVMGYDVDSNALQTTIQRVIDGLKEWGRLDDTTATEVQYRVRLQSAATLLHQNALCEEFHNDHVEDAIELFARLNKGGTSLSAGEVEAARLSREATAHIVDPMRTFVQNQHLSALGFNFSFVTRTLVTIHRGSAGFAKLPRNWAADADELDYSWLATQKGLEYAAKLVREELGWATRRWLPSANALIPVAYLFKNHAKLPSIQERESLKRYLLLTGLRGLFRGSVETSINTYVNPIKTARANTKNRALLLVKRIPQSRLFRIKPGDIKSTTGMYSPLMQIYLSYLIFENAKSWPSGRPIREIAMGSVPGDPLAVHHIFPKKYMMSLGFPPEQFNTMANYAILAQSDNAKLADRAPAEVYADFSPQERNMASAQLFFRASDELLDPQAYDEFLDYRAKHLAEELNRFLGL
jgi:hypothetical protein